MASSEIVSISSLDSETVLSLFEKGIASGKFVFAPADPEETARRIALRDLAATSADELLGGGSSEVISGKNYTNKPFTLTSVEWQRSDDVYAGAGLPFYAVCHIFTLDGEEKVLTCGASTVVRKLAKIAVEGWLPIHLKIVKGPKTEAGFEPLDLVKADF